MTQYVTPTYQHVTPTYTGMFTTTIISFSAKPCTVLDLDVRVSDWLIPVVEEKVHDSWDFAYARVRGIKRLPIKSDEDTSIERFRFLANENLVNNNPLWSIYGVTRTIDPFRIFLARVTLQNLVRGYF